MLSKERAQKLKSYIRQRQMDLSIVLENVHDPHNIGAIMRTCDAVGIDKMYVIYTQESKNARIQYVGHKAARGTKKWVTCHFYNTVQECVNQLKKEKFDLWATHLGVDAKSLYELHLSDPVALVFGNEKDGVSEELLQHCKGNFTIPMAGLVQSLNVSVAVAVSCYEAMRQRTIQGKYDLPFDYNNTEMYEKFKEAVIKTYPRIAETDINKIDDIIQKTMKSEE